MRESSEIIAFVRERNLARYLFVILPTLFLAWRRGGGRDEAVDAFLNDEPLDENEHVVQTTRYTLY